MKWVWRVIILAALAALGIWIWTVFFPTEEKVIRRNLKELAESASSSGTEGSLAKFGNIAQVAGYFSPSVEIGFDIPGEGHFEITGRDEIMALAARARDLPGGIKVEFPDVEVTVNPDGETASADVTGRVQQGRDRDFAVQEFKLSFKKIKGDWLITRVETVKTLSTVNPPNKPKHGAK